MALKVFISHGAKKDSTRAVRDSLYDALAEKENIVPIVDKEDLEPGTSWRSTINAWLCGCDAAVVLLCKDALKSNFVAYEVSILSYRHTDQQDGFTLIPVFIDGVDYPAIQSSALSPTFIEEVQGIAIDGNAGSIAQAVTEKLTSVAENAQSLTEDRLADIHSILQNVNRDAELRRGYERLIAWERELGIESKKHNIEKWFPGHALPKKLALKMMAAGLNGSSITIRHVRSFLADPRALNLKELMDILSSSWVDHKSSKVISKLPLTSNSLGVQTEHREVVEIYVKCACPFSMQDSWRVVGLNLIHGHDFEYEDLKREVESVLMEELDINDPARIRSKTETRAEQYEDYVFVTIPGDSVPDKYVYWLKKEEAFEYVIFVKMRKNPPGQAAEDSSGEITWLSPPLDPDIESEYLNMELLKKELLSGIR